MGRPTKEYSMRVSGKYLQCYKQGVYLGCVTREEICKLVEYKKAKGIK